MNLTYTNQCRVYLGCNYGVDATIVSSFNPTVWYNTAARPRRTRLRHPPGMHMVISAAPARLVRLFMSVSRESCRRCTRCRSIQEHPNCYLALWLELSTALAYTTGATRALDGACVCDGNHQIIHMLVMVRYLTH
jgi:hypothetical protein